MSLNEVKVSVGRLEEQMGGLRELIQQQFEGLHEVLDLRAEQWNTENANRDDRLDKITKRQNRVERKVYWFSGAGTVLGMVFGAIIASVSDKLFHAS